MKLSGLGGAATVQRLARPTIVQRLARPATVQRLARPAVLAATALVFGRALRRNALDDAYVTYRYAENLLAGLGPVYNPGEPVLSTTALGYGLLLAVLKLALPWAALPALSNAVSALGLCALALALHALCARNCRPWAGLGAGLLALLSPLLLSTFGLETCLFLGMVGWSAVAFDAGRWRAAALLGALATVVRADGALAFAILLGAAAARARRPPLGPVALYAAIVFPYELALALVYGSPTPTTLAAKVAQATIGGWPDYLGGLRLLLGEWVALSPPYWLALPLLLAGLVALPRAPWAVPLVAWGAAQAVAYQLLGVASYGWYYAPLIPGAALLVVLGADGALTLALSQRARGRRQDPFAQKVDTAGEFRTGVAGGRTPRCGAGFPSAVGGELPSRRSNSPAVSKLRGRGCSLSLWERVAHPAPPRGHPAPGTRRVRAPAPGIGALILLAPLLWAELTGVQALRAATPEPRAVAYERVGRWLADNSAPNEQVAVMEVGVIGYYAGRPMVDLLGLIRPETIAALHRQDFFWTIADSQADLVVLTGKNPLWFQFAEPSHWFHQFYAPVERIEQPGFWGTPLTVYRRQSPPRGPPELDDRTDLRFGDAIALDRAAVERLTARPGDYLTVQLFWRSLRPIERDYAAFVHVVSAEPRVVAQHDTPVVATRWPAGQAVQYYHPMRLPSDLAPGRYSLEVGLYLPEAPLRRLPPSQPHERNVAVVAALTVAR